MNREGKILFRDQFIACKKENLVGEHGPFVKWKDNPNMLPFCSLAGKKILEELKKDPEAGFETLECKRFGGECSGRNIDCKRLRGIID